METTAITQSELLKSIKDLQPYLYGNMPNIFLNQYSSVEEYVKIKSSFENFSEKRRNLEILLPDNSWVRVVIEGEEYGIIKLQTGTPFGYISGITLEKWKNSMPNYRSYAQFMAFKEIFKRHKFIFIFSSIVIFLWVLSQIILLFNQ